MTDVKRALLTVLLGLLILTFSLPVFAERATGKLPPTAPSEKPVVEDAEAEEPVDLYIFLWDRCGGCGVDVPGCGECRDTERFHLSVKDQLGARLYDGSLTYRILNCRYEENREKFEKFSTDYNVAEAWFDYLPAVFIGRNGSGVYMVGEDAIEDVGATLDAYLGGEDLEELQQALCDKYEASLSKEE